MISPKTNRAPILRQYLSTERKAGRLTAQYHQFVGKIASSSKIFYKSLAYKHKDVEICAVL